MSREVKRFMKEKGYSGYVDRVGIRKDYRRRGDWQFKTLEHVLDEYRLWKKKAGRITQSEAERNYEKQRNVYN